MPLKPSEDFGCAILQSHEQVHSGSSTITSSLRPTMRSPHVRGDKDIVPEHAKFSTNSLRVDIFGVKEGGVIDSALIAPLRPSVPTLKRGKTYLLEVVLRTLRVGASVLAGHGGLERNLGRCRRQERRTCRGSQRWYGPVQGGRSVVALHQRLHARQGRQSHRPPQSAEHLHAALQQPDSARRWLCGALLVHRARGRDGPAHLRREAELPEVRHDLLQLRVRAGLLQRPTLPRDERSADSPHRAGQSYFPD